MSAAGTGLYDCPPLQDEITKYFTTCDAALLPDPSPFNEFLWSGLNRAGIQQVLQPGQNKVRTLQLRYDQRYLESDVEAVADCARVCTSSNKVGDLITTYTIDTCDKLRYGQNMDAEDFKFACRNNMDIINKKLRMMMNVMLQAVATRMAERAITHFGHWANIVSPKISDGGVDTFTMKTLKDGTEDIYPQGMYKLDMAIKKNNFCDGAVIFGGTVLKEYADLMKAGCCANQGLDLKEILSQYGYAVTWDRRIEAQFGDTLHAMVLGVKALQPVSYTRNNDGTRDAVGLRIGADYQKQVIFEPSTGLPIDLTITDKCEEGLSIIMETVVDLVALPADLFAPGDYMEGVNWINKVKVVNV